MKNIPYGRQHIDSSDIKAVSEAMKADLITTGDYVKKFENIIAKLLRVKFAISCNSGTSAIHLAFLSINLSKNDVVIMPAINFIAAYNLAKIMGAKIFLADVDPSTGQMTPAKLLECINKNKIKKIKAIVTMYLGGYPENVIEFYKIKKKLGFLLIEDACHALGAQYNFSGRNIYIGSCKHSDISTFSISFSNTILFLKVLIIPEEGIPVLLFIVGISGVFRGCTSLYSSLSITTCSVVIFLTFLKTK
jgi:dTDP-4-amino-4,6-dideoxygalactose transaminase